jgi:hypothetical protein
MSERKNRNSTTFRDKALEVCLSRGDEAFHLVLTDRATGATWGPAPLLRLEIHDKMQRRNDIVGKYRIDGVEELGNGLHLSIGDSFHGIRVGLWLRIAGGELSVLVQPVEAYEDKMDLYRLFAIDLLPGLATVSRHGSLLLPVTTGYRCLPADKPAISERFLIYGEQERWELLPTLPFCAVESPGGGLMQLAAKGACDTECRVETDGEGGGCARLGFSFRKTWHDPLDPEHREIITIPIPATMNADAFCGKRIRRHVVEDLGKKTIAERIAESPEVEYLVDAYIMKMFFAIEHEGLCMNGMARTSPMSFLRYMTFAQAEGHLKRLRDAGIAKILTESVGWNPRGHDGMYPTRQPVDERLGGEKAFREMNLRGRDLGFHMSIHDNYIDAYQCSPDWDPETTIHDSWGEPLISGHWGGGINYRQWPLAFTSARLEGEMRRMRGLGINGMLYCDGMGNPLEVNYHPRHRGPRSGHAKGICRILDAARKTAGAVSTETAFLYCCLPADCIASNGWGWDMKRMKPEWRISQLCDDQRPVWHFALHDLVVHEGHGHTWRDVMEKILLGAQPRAEWTGADGLYHALTDAMIGAYKAEFDLVIGKCRHLRLLEMTSFERPSAEFARSTFSDGTAVEADFRSGILSINGKTIRRPAAIPLERTRSSP